MRGLRGLSDLLLYWLQCLEEQLKHKAIKAIKTQNINKSVLQDRAERGNISWSY